MTDPQRIIIAGGELLTSVDAYDSMSCKSSPFGDGRASERIVSVLLRDTTGYPVQDGASQMFGTVY